MRAKQGFYYTHLWLSASDTYEWAHRPGAAWPCSTLSGRRVFVAFERNGDLIDFTVDGSDDVDDVDGHELTAITSDFLRDRFGPEHPAIRD